MADSSKHSNHALENLKFIDNICQEFPGIEYRWKTVSAFYTAVQLINAFLADKLNAHPDTHIATKRLINPFHGNTVTRLSQQLYLHYENLEILSRKARYTSQMNFREKHFVEAIEHLNELIVFYTTEYPSSPVIRMDINCFDSGLTRNLHYFQIKLSLATSES